MKSNMIRLCLLSLLFPLVSFAAQLEEVLVTAQKKTENIQDIPIAIGVVSGESLADFSISSTADLDDSTPGLVIQEAPGNLSTVTLRGVGTAPGNESFDQSVSLFVDGVWAGRQREFSSALFDIERVEVIKGTQNSLLGKNTSLGAISLLTKNPGEEFAGSISTEYETEYNSQLVNAAVDIPIGYNLLTRFAINYKDKIGDVENITSGENLPQTEQLALRFKAAFDIGNTGNAVFTYQTEHLEILGDNFQVAFDNSHQIRDQAPGTPIGTDDGIKSGFTSLGEDGESFDEQDSQRANLTLNFDIGDSQVTSVTGYSRYTNERKIDADFTAQDFIFQATDSDFEQISQELRLTLPELSWMDGMVGAFFLKNEFSKRIPTYATVPLFGENSALSSLLRPFTNGQGQFDLGLFVEKSDINFSALPDFLGFLLDPEAQRLNNFITSIPAGVVHAALNDGSLSGFDFDALDFEDLLGEIDKLLPGSDLNSNDLALFGINGAFESTFQQETYSRSFFGQTTFYLHDNVNLITGLRYTNEKKTAVVERFELAPGLIHELSFPKYELTRMSLNEKSLDGSINLQYYFNDINMAYITWGKGTKSGGFADQATKLEDVPYDKEVATTLEIGSKMEFLDGAARLNMAAFHTKIEDYQFVLFVGLGFETSNLQAESKGFEFDGQLALSEHLFLTGGATYAKAKDVDTGLGLPLSPELTSNLGIRYQNTFLNGLAYTIDLGANYRSEMFHNLKQEPPASKAVTRYDTRLALGDEAERWEVALIGKNLTDEKVVAISGEMPGISDGSAAAAATEPRRTITLQANYNF